MEQIHVVVIDDERGLTGALLPGSNTECRYELVDVADMQEDEVQDVLREATVVLVDHDLKPLRESSPPTASNGLALIGVLREYLSKPSSPAADDGRAPLLALFTGDETIVSKDPRDPNAHLRARALGFDWAFAKGVDESLTVALPALAQGAAEIDAAFSAEVGSSSFDRLFELLRVSPDVLWVAAARREVAGAQPPVFGVGRSARPEEVRRWLLHRIVPYPTFLLEETYVAARLALTLPDFRRVLQSELGASFKAVEYSGPLAGFAGPRYWRTGVEAVVREVAGGFDGDKLRRALQNRVGHSLDFVDNPRPVVVLNAKLAPESQPAEPRDSVRIHVDDWPSYAEPPRMRRETARVDELRHMVVAADVDLLGGEPA